jgi:hypothetical protein
MQSGEYLYVIGVGSAGDFQAQRGGIYHIADSRGEIALPVFTSPELATEYVNNTLNKPGAHMQMLESVGANVDTHADALTGGRFLIMPVDAETLAGVTERIEADYLIRDIRPGEDQEILRLCD